MKSKKYNWKLHNKTVKHPYTGAKLDDRTCRNHGSCLRCRDDRLYQSNKKLREMRQKLNEFLEEKDEEWLGIGKVIDLTGHRFGRLTVLERADNYVSPLGQKKTRWVCKCDCGNETILTTTQLTRKTGTKSCGCLRKEIASELHKKQNRYDLTGEYGIGYSNDGKVCFYFDLQDYNIIKEYYWGISSNKYIYTRLPRCDGHKVIFQHRLIMQCDDNQEVDHINHVTYDNRRSNLRIVTSSQNKMNTKTRKSNTGVRGVYQTKNFKFNVMISVNKKRLYLGTFDNLEDAIAVRKQAEDKYYGEYSFNNSNKEIINNEVSN